MTKVGLELTLAFIPKAGLELNFSHLLAWEHQPFKTFALIFCLYPSTHLSFESSSHHRSERRDSEEEKPGVQKVCRRSQNLQEPSGTFLLSIPSLIKGKMNDVSQSRLHPGKADKSFLALGGVVYFRYKVEEPTLSEDVSVFMLLAWLNAEGARNAVPTKVLTPLHSARGSNRRTADLSDQQAQRLSH
ncbi:hypothetical protein L345_07914, partial [Ophiophagus hannah]